MKYAFNVQLNCHLYWFQPCRTTDIFQLSWSKITKNDQFCPWIPTQNDKLTCLERRKPSSCTSIPPPTKSSILRQVESETFGRPHPKVGLFWQSIPIIAPLLLKKIHFHINRKAQRSFHHHQGSSVILFWIQIAGLNLCSKISLNNLA